MSGQPIDGCSGCAGTAGRNGCPYHGPQVVGPAQPVYSEMPVFTRADRDELFRSLRRIVELLERLTGVSR